MTHSITEEMRFRQRLCEYAKKYGVTKAARKYLAALVTPYFLAYSHNLWRNLISSVIL